METTSWLVLAVALGAAGGIVAAAAGAPVQLQVGLLLAIAILAIAAALGYVLSRLQQAGKDKGHGR